LDIQTGHLSCRTDLSLSRNFKRPLILLFQYIRIGQFLFVL